MKKLLMILLTAVFLAGGATCWAAEYVMSPGDTLRISVLGHEDLGNGATQTSRDTMYMVRPDGRVNFPLVGEVDTTGLTISEFTEKLKSRLAEYLLNPEVTVNIVQLGTTRVFVLGEVNKPGLYELTKSHRVVDAIGAANGFTKDAAKKKIFLIRDGKEDNMTRINLNNYLTKGDIKQNVVLREGDCLYLSSNGRFNFSTDILPWLSGWYMSDRIRNHD